MYELIHDINTGKVNNVKRLSDGAFTSLNPTNADFQAFLIWNAEQAVPLDLDSTITPEPPIVYESTADKLAKVLKDKGIITDKEFNDLEKPVLSATLTE